MREIFNAIPFVFILCGGTIVAAVMGLAIYSRNNKLILALWGKV